MVNGSVGVIIVVVNGSVAGSGVVVVLLDDETTSSIDGLFGMSLVEFIICGINDGVVVVSKLGDVVDGFGTITTFVMLLILIGFVLSPGIFIIS